MATDQLDIHDTDAHTFCADTRAAVLFALSTYAKAGFDGVTKSKALNRLSASLDSDALEAYASELMSAFTSGTLRLADNSDTATERGCAANGAVAEGVTQAAVGDEAAAAEAAAAVASVQRWALGQLGQLVKMKRCSQQLAKRVVLFMAAVAFVDVGAKAVQSKLSAVQQLAACQVGWSDDVRSFATSRTFVLATDVLPCMSAPLDDTRTGDKAADARKAAPAGSQAKTRGASLLPEVRLLHSAHVRTCSCIALEHSCMMSRDYLTCVAALTTGMHALS